MATYAIGDIQGCLEGLTALLGAIDFDPEQDRLWVAGDLVNRGPESLAVLRLLRGLGERVKVVLGNHDLHLLMVAAGARRANDYDTFHDILEAPDGPELIEWLAGQALMFREGDVVMVHAGLLPAWTVDESLALAGEVSAALAGPQRREFLHNLYGSKPDRWSPDLKGWDRLRVIVNAMTRMRFCSPEGRMEFKAKGRVDAPPSGYLPWFQVPGRRSRACTVLFGHWSALGYWDRDGVVGLDTGCVWGGTLTALRLEDRRVFQVRCRQVLVPDGSE